jgi:hypothetical protein
MPELARTSGSPEWSVPAPVRALLWWPPVAFVLVVLAPHAAAESIAVAGAVLAVIGVVGAALGRRLARRPVAAVVEECVRLGVDENPAPAYEQRAA